MNEKVYHPIPVPIVKLLTDKVYDKRKSAASEIEKMTKEFISSCNYEQVEKLILVLTEQFALSQASNNRQGGLIGIAAVTVALGRESKEYNGKLIPPVIACFNDPDSRVRYYACESLYNVIKILRESCLSYFNEIFDCISRLCADPDQNVRSGADLVDKLVKDIVAETPSFDLTLFVPLIRERMYTNNVNAKRFVICWLAFLEAVPDISLIPYLTEVIDGIFQILEDPSPELRRMCVSLLDKYISQISSSTIISGHSFSCLVNILIVHSKSLESLVHCTALNWLLHFLTLDGFEILRYTAAILTSVIPCFSVSTDPKKNIENICVSINKRLKKKVKLCSTSSKHIINEDNLFNEIISVLMLQISDSGCRSRIIAFQWLLHLQKNFPEEFIVFVDILTPTLSEGIFDLSEQVLLLDLNLIAAIHNSLPDPAATDWLVKVFNRLFERLRRDDVIFKTRAAIIIRHLCVALDAEKVYKILSDILLTEKNLNFAASMVQLMNVILLTSTELFELRNRIKCLRTKTSKDLFVNLYKTWSYDPVATLAICLLSQNYMHAYKIVQLFANIEICVDFLIELDKLLQLIESPVFTFLRLQLLSYPSNHYLIKTLYGILMLLPQTDAFEKLKNRLDCIPHYLSRISDSNSVDEDVPEEKFDDIDFDELLHHFEIIALARAKEKKSKYTDLFDSDVEESTETADTNS